MKSTRLLLAVVLYAAGMALAVTALGLGAASAVAAAEALPDVAIQGSNTLRLSRYNYRGDPATASYRDEGNTWYNELQLGLDQEFSPQNFWHAEGLAVYNKDGYRSDDRDAVLERFSVMWENGDAPVPFRAEAGDIYTDLSYRTISRTLKGLQLDLQPDLTVLDGQSSFLIFGGTDQPAWREMEPDRSLYTGASWLLNQSRLGSFSLNWVHNVRETDAFAGGKTNRQHVLSLAGEQRWEMLGQKLTLDSELASFAGDHDGSAAGDDGRNRNDWGAFLQVAGRNQTPLRYRLRFEQYGADFRPEGANVARHRRSYESHASWTFPNQTELGGRLQRYEQNYETGNTTTADVVGLRWSGPVLAPLDPALHGSIDGYVRHSENEDHTVDTRSDVLRADFSRPVTETWSADTGFSVQRNRTDTAGGPTDYIHQVRLGGTRRLSFSGWDGSLSPGVVRRWTQGDSSDSRDWNPTLMASLTRGGHNVNLSATLTDQAQLDLGTVDNVGYTYAASYNYSRGPHTFGVEYDANGVDPNPGLDGSSYKVSAFYTYRFGGRYSFAQRRWSAPAARGADLGLGTGLPAAAREEPGVNVLTAVPPGLAIADARALLADKYQLRTGVVKPEYDSFEKRLLPEFDQRQRLVLLHQAGKVTKSALVMDLDDVGNLDTIEEVFTKARKHLVDALGKPVTFQEEGDFTANLRVDLERGRFVRLYEWATPSGVLRFGIPRRLDRKVRLEIQHAQSFPEARAALWSIEPLQ